MTKRQLELKYGPATPAGPRREYKPFVPGPNPNLPEFIRNHSTPYDPATDWHEVGAFDRACRVGDAAEPKAIFDLHFCKGKKQWSSGGISNRGRRRASTSGWSLRAGKRRDGDFRGSGVRV